MAKLRSIAELTLASVIGGSCGFVIASKYANAYGDLRAFGLTFGCFNGLILHSFLTSFVPVPRPLLGALINASVACALIRFLPALSPFLDWLGMNIAVVVMHCLMLTVVERIHSAGRSYV